MSIALIFLLHLPDILVAYILILHKPMFGEHLQKRLRLGRELPFLRFVHGIKILVIHRGGANQ